MDNSIAGSWELVSPERGRFDATASRKVADFDPWAENDSILSKKEIRIGFLCRDVK